MESLIEKLRQAARESFVYSDLLIEAANAITELIHSCDEMSDQVTALYCAVPKWIPVTERLPEENGWYLVNVEAPYKPIRIYKFEPIKGNYGNNLWRDGDGGDGFYVADWFVTHWMPLPEPPEDGET